MVSDFRGGSTISVGGGGKQFGGGEFPLPGTAGFSHGAGGLPAVGERQHLGMSSLSKTGQSSSGKKGASAPGLFPRRGDALFPRSAGSNFSGTSRPEQTGGSSSSTARLLDSRVGPERHPANRRSSSSGGDVVFDHSWSGADVGHSHSWDSTGRGGSSFLSFPPGAPGKKGQHRVSATSSNTFPVTSKGGAGKKFGAGKKSATTTSWMMPIVPGGTGTPPHPGLRGGLFPRGEGFIGYRVATGGSSGTGGKNKWSSNGGYAVGSSGGVGSHGGGKSAPASGTYVV